MKQCEAMTQPSYYSKAHRCLKKNGVKKIGKRYLCAHHKNTNIQDAASAVKR